MKSQPHLGCSLIRLGLRWWLVGALVVFWAGCVIPLPSISGARAGQPVTRARAAFIRPGQTRREELFAALGTNYFALHNNLTIAYAWEKPGMDIRWYAVGAIPWVGAATNFANHAAIHGWRAFFVHFGTNDLVAATAYASLSANVSLQEQLERWERKLKPRGQ